MTRLFRVFIPHRLEPFSFTGIVRTHRTEPPLPYEEAIEDYRNLDDGSVYVSDSRVMAERAIDEFFTLDEAFRLGRYLMEEGVHVLLFEEVTLPLQPAATVSETPEGPRRFFAGPFAEMVRFDERLQLLPLELKEGYSLDFPVTAVLAPEGMWSRGSLGSLGPAPAPTVTKAPGPSLPS